MSTSVNSDVKTRDLTPAHMALSEYHKKFAKQSNEEIRRKIDAKSKELK